ncbi:hypothetical protein Glove_139g288 [Diversispora epigaea]|uniref:BTB domain-containing protein n=1 Tax=Diversispora epigaea TaxID=1348612 RepID=A0A397J5G9_9GLOM|nr:hypothetical protein Glove_139g288 [Diversispora epigaea]
MKKAKMDFFQDFLEFLNEKKEYNTIIEVDQEENKKSFTAHSVVFHYRIAQNPTLPTDSKEWSKENFYALNITLQHCLPLIRYFHISSEDILEKVKLYEKILEEQLWDDILYPQINRPVNSLVLPSRIISNPELPSRTISTIITFIMD